MESVPMTIFTGGAAQATGNLVGPATDAGKGIYKYLKRKYEYIQNLDQNFMNLEEEARYLTSRKMDVDDLIAKNQLIKQKTHECATWINDVEKITADLNDMRIKYQKTGSGSSGLSQLRARLKLSKQAEEMRRSVIDLKDRLNPEHIILTESGPERLEKFPKNISEVPSLRENVEKLIEFLNDDSIKKIGIWGMSGVGKTTVLENLNEEVVKLQMFDIVIWVTVSKEDSLAHIQQTILKQLTSNVDAINRQCQANMFISKALETKKYLLILDDVSSKIELRHLGIHDEHMQGKVVLSTRGRTLCYAMEMDDDIKIERMSRDDARKLFRDVVGKVVDKPNLTPIAERIVIQCGEQPQVIRAVGNYLKRKSNEDLWNSTLSKLQSPNMYRLEHLEDLFIAFKLIYEELDIGLQGCLLYGASFPEDHEIYGDYIVECWRTEQLIGIDQTLRKACEEGHACLEYLIDNCIFDRCQSIKHVKMPIIFRNSAIRMAQLNNFGLLIGDEDDFEEHPSALTWKNARVISLMTSNLTVLPQQPECTRISTLFLQKNEKLQVIPDLFFDRMSTLKNLDLCGTGIKELPPSVSKLTNLRGLYLNDCHQLRTLPKEVGELQSLQLLDISHSGISGFPLVIGELTGLQCLRVSFSSGLANQNNVQTDYKEPIMTSIFERLTRLEELAIAAHPNNQKWIDVAPAIAAKLANLKRLSALTFYFPSVESLEAFFQASISNKNGTCQTRPIYRSFNIYVGSHGNSKSSQLGISKCVGRRYLQYSGGKHIPGVIKDVLKTACVAFELINHQDITCLSDLDIDGMESLEICAVESCSAMEVILDSNLAGGSAFPWLEELHLVKLCRLKHISQGPVPPNSFAKLTKLIFYECPQISHAISRQMGIQLKELQQLRVQKCSQVTEIFEEGLLPTLLCPKLKILELDSLEGLVSIHADSMIVWYGLQKMEIIRCDKLNDLCLTKMNARKLRHIACNKVWWETLAMSDEIRAHLLPFCCFVEDI